MEPAFAYTCGGCGCSLATLHALRAHVCEWAESVGWLAARRAGGAGAGAGGGGGAGGGAGATTSSSSSSARSSSLAATTWTRTRLAERLGIGSAGAALAHVRAARCSQRCSPRRLRRHSALAAAAATLLAAPRSLLARSSPRCARPAPAPPPCT